MRHKLALSLILMAFLIPASALAVGLGELTMHSALDEPMDAEIELTSVQSEEFQELEVGLASPDLFELSGVDYMDFLRDFNYEVLKKEDGTAYIKITSTEAVKEPFLNFLVELKWPKGRLVRQYTVLVDPPTLVDEKPAGIEVTTIKSTGQRVTREETTTIRSTKPKVRTVSPTPSSQPANLTRMNDTAWAVAMRMRPDSSMSVHQVMLALLKENPKAFYGDNINNLKAGYVLRLENPELIASISNASARQEVARQYEIWKLKKAGQPVPMGLQQDVDVAGAGGEAGAAGAAGVAAAQTSARLKLLSPGAEAQGVGTAQEGEGGELVESLRSELTLANEALEANRQETDELRTRLASLEEQLESMNKLIELQDNAVAAVKGGLVEAAKEEPQAQPQAQPQDKKVQPVIPPAPPEPKWYEDTMLLAIAAVAVLVIGALGWIVMRRRNSGDDFHESILNTVTAMSPDANEADAAGGPTPGETSVLTDFAMSAIEGIQTEVGEVDLISEADVYLAYGRYSQAEEIIQSALTLNPDREDLKLKLLEIFHAAKEEEKFIQFAQEFHDTLGGESHPQWERISAMGYDLNPEHPLFGGGPVPQGADDLESLDTDDLSTPVDESLDELTEAAAETSDENELEFDVGSLDMGETESIEEEVQTEELASAEQTADTNELEFDVSSLDMGETESVEEEVVSEDVGLDLEAGTMEATEESTEEAGLEFDVASLDVGEDSGGLESAAAELEAAMEEPSEGESVLAESEELDAGDNILEFNLGDEESMEEVVETAVVDTAPESGDELDDLSLDLSDLGGDDEVFAGLDDADTKLDLAKAYIDMEDQDSAKSMLDEVVEEGTDEQKKQAQELLQKIG